MPSWLARKYAKKKMKFMRRYVLPVMNHLQSDSALSSRLSLMLRAYFYPEYRIHPFASYGDCSLSLAELYPACTSRTSGPRSFEAAPQVLESGFAPIEAHSFESVVVSSKASAIRKGNQICRPAFYIERPDTTIADGAFLISDASGKGLLREATPVPLSHGIAVFGSGALNWYHWLIEILPSAAFAQRLNGALKDYPLLVPQECLTLQNFHDALTAAAGNRTIIPLQAGQFYRVGHLVVIDPPVHGPMNMRQGLWPTLSDYAQNATALRDYRQSVLNSLALPALPANRRLFLARGNGRRSYNQDEILDIAAEFDFEIVYPEKMSFREQVALYQQARMLIGPSGAAFANILFCEPGAQALTWILPQYRQFCVYSNLADVAGLDLTYLFVTPDQAIASSFDAYNATYQVDPVAFRNTLAAMLALP